jgi:hypothetical protein
MILAAGDRNFTGRVLISSLHLYGTEVYAP